MKKVITYGTFDLFHQGHYNILKRAKEYGDYLIVGVTGDSYDEGRGKLSVHDNVAKRIENVKATGFADEIIIEEYLGQKISDIIKYDIDTFVIGDDWRGKFDHLSKYCEMVYLERTKNISSTQLRKENFDVHRIGIITDVPYDNELVKEAGKVTGFEVTSIYADNKFVLDSFQDKYDVDSTFRQLDDFLNAVDIVYIRGQLENRAEYIRSCLEAGKHVIADPPFTLNPQIHQDLLNLAKEKHAALIDNVKMVYVKTFIQLLWMTQGGLIGDIIRVNCSISKQDKDIKNLFDDLSALALCPVIKIMGTNYTNMESELIRNSDGDIEYGSILLRYENCIASLNIGNAIRVKDQLEIIGTKGSIRLGEHWWKSDYFELEKVDGSQPEIYNMNFEGNGFAFLLKDMLTMFSNGKTESKGLFPEESLAIVEILSKIHQA